MTIFGIVISFETLVVLSVVLIAVLYAAGKVFIWQPVNRLWMNKVKGLTLYRFERIPGAGPIPTWYKWYKDDDNAFRGEPRADFIESVYPTSRRVKPLS